MNLTPSKIEFSDHEHRDIRRDVEQAKTYDGLTEAEVGRQSDVSPSTLNAYLKGSYKGDNNSPAAQLHKWLQARRLALETRSTRPEHPPFQPLRQSQTIINLLSYARETGRIVVIAGSPGVCKTASARQFASDTPRTWLATMDDTTAGVSPMLTEILSAMGEPDAKGTPRALSRRVSDKAEEAKSLIIIDEANHLTDKAIDQLRAINDRARARGLMVGIALVGNEVVYGRVGTAGTKAAFAQVSSRIAMRRYLVEPDPSDVAAMAHAWAAANREDVGPREIDFLKKIAAKPGGLRNVEKTFEAAVMAARGASEPLTLSHLQGAFDQNSGLTRAA